MLRYYDERASEYEEAYVLGTVDSAWSTERARFNAKIERQERRLNDGTRFDIYKRYCDREDISGWATHYGVTISVEHFGTAFYAVSGSFV